MPTTRDVPKRGSASVDIHLFDAGFRAGQGKPTSILIERVRGLGDVLQLLPALKAVKKKYGSAKLDFKTSSVFFPLLKRFDFIDHLIREDASKDQLSKYSLVMDLQNKVDFLPICKEAPRQDLFAKLLNVNAKCYQLKFNFPVYKKEITNARSILRAGGWRGEKLLGLHLMTYSLIRTWPIERSLDFVDKLSDYKDLKIVILEHHAIREKFRKFGHVIIPDKTELIDLIGLLSLCDYTVCPDSGVMHLAGLLKVPTVALFGPIPPEFRIKYYPRTTGISLNLDCQPCFLPEQEILTSSGLYPINQLQKDDLVLTHALRFRPIRKTMKRKYQGDILKIGFRKLPFPVLSLTPEHPVLVCDFNGIHFKPANQLRIGDQAVVSFPIKDEEKLQLTTSDFLESTDYVLEGNQICQKTRPSSNQRKVHRCSNQIQLNADFYRLVGYFLAEGSLYRNYIQFTFHIDERNYVEDVQQLMKSVFGLEMNEQPSSIGKWTTLKIACRPVSMLFRKLFGKGAENLRIPEFMMLAPHVLQIELLKGVVRGDGFLLRDSTKRQDCNNGFGITLANKSLIYQLWLILLRNNLAGSINDNMVNAWRLTCRGQNLNLMTRIFPERQLPLQTKTKEYFQRAKNYYLFRVNKIEIEEYSGEVFNLEVDEDESYSAGGIIVHNCFDWQTHACRKRPNYRQCLKDITPEMVIGKLEEIGCF